MRLCKAVACWVLLGLIPSLTFALGLGDIRLESALNQPFSAEVPLNSLEDGQLNEIAVSMASRETFERYGLDRPEFLNDFSFLVTTSDSGQAVIRIASKAPVAEPFVTLLLDVKWRSGRLQREYTVLLDPPVFEDIAARSAPAETVAEVPAEPEQVTVEPEPVVSDSVILEAEPEPAGIIQTESAPIDAAEETAEDAVVAQEEQPAEGQIAEGQIPEEQIAEEEIASQEPAAIAQDASPEPPAAELTDSYTTDNGDTLWSIASRSKPAGLTTNQMMLAIYRANPEAFRGNINALQAGAILRIPPAEDTDGLSASEAEAEAKQQHSSWTGQKQPEPVADAVSDAPQLELVPPTSSEFAADGQGQGEAADADSSAQLNEFESEAESSEGLLSVTDPEMEALQDRIAESEESQAPAEGLEIDEIGEEVGESETDILVEGIDEPLESPFADEAEMLEDDALIADEESMVETMPVEESPAQPVQDIAEQGEGSIVSMLMDYAIWIGGALLILVALFLLRGRAGTLVGRKTEKAAKTEASEPSFDQTVKDFSNLPSAGKSIIVDEADETENLDEAATDVVPETQLEPEPEPSYDDFSSTVVDGASETTSVADDFESAETISDGAQDVDDSDETTFDRIADEEAETPLEKTISTGAPLDLDQADPIAEADFHMAYGLYDQAADLLVRALEEDPNNREYRVKLLEVYFVWENKDGFLDQATALHNSISDESDPDWNKVLILGKQLCPDAEIFSGGDAVAPVADAMDFELGDDEGEMDLDLSLGGNEIKALDEPAEEAGLDFDLGADTSVSESGDDDFLLDLDEADAAAEDIDKPPATVKLDDEDLAATLESPTLDASGPDAPTVEADMLGATVESPTLEMPEPTSMTSNMPALDELGEALSEELAPDSDESSTDDTGSLDVDLTGLADFSEPDAHSSSNMDIDSTLNQLDNTGELLKPEDVEDFSRTLVEDDDNVAEALQADESNTLAENAATEIFQPEDQTAKLSIDEGDTAEQPTDSFADTAEQPGITESFDDVFDGAIPGDATMTEVGTKLDLARAYIDMGDPDGARSILKEVLDEGGEPQQQQARQLLEELGG